MDARFFIPLVGFFCWTSAQQLHCPGPGTISCLTATPVFWEGTAFDGQCAVNARSFGPEVNIGKIFSCGVLSVTITNVTTTMIGNFNVTTVASSLSFNAQPSLSGLTVRCTTGSNDANYVELLIPDITPNVSVSVIQNSLTAVTLTINVGDSPCASLYFVEVTQMDNSDSSIVMRSSSSSINVTGLDLCRNRYTVVGYVEAPSGVQGGRSLSQTIPSGVAAVRNVTDMQPLTLYWTQPANTAPDGCILGYVISWTDGQDTTIGLSTSVLVSNLSNFPFCQIRTLTVTPNTPSGLLSTGASLQDVVFQHPGFAAPNVSAFFSLQSNRFFININWQVIPLDTVSLRMFGFSEIGEDCNPQDSETSSSVTWSVPGAQSGNNYTVCVVFINDQCTERTDINVTVPVPVITDPKPTTGDTSFSVTITLPPSPPMSPDTLSILSTIDPPHARMSTVLENYPASGQQYTVTFEGLTPGTTYIYDIRVVLRNDSTTTIGLPLMEPVTVPECGTVCVTVVVVVVCVLVVVAVLSLAGGCGAYKYKNRSKDPKERSSKSEDTEKHKLTCSSPPPGPDSLYADPNTIEHQPAPGTEDQYAMVDKKGNKNTKPKPTPPEALYQDPNTIEHEAAVSGDTYAVVDKHKRSSKKKGGPDVVPPPSEGLTYADIDLSSKRPKPGSGRQAPQQPGEYPKEHPVEYSSVDHGNTSQL